MSKNKKRQDSGKSQVSLVASRLAEVLPRYGTPALKHAQAIEIAAIAGGFRSSNAAIAAAREIGPMPKLTLGGAVATAHGTMHVLLDPGSGRAFGVDQAFKDAPPAGCVPTPYGTLADTSGVAGGKAAATTQVGRTVPPIHVCYFEHRHGHEHFAALSEEALYDQLEAWCREWNADAFEDKLSKADDRKEAVDRFLDSRTEGWHTDVITDIDGGAATQPQANAAHAGTDVYTATVSHRHGESVFVGEDEEDLDAQIAAYCIQSEDDLPQGKRFHGPVEFMTSEQIISHYFENIEDETLHRNGVTGSVRARPDVLSASFADLLKVFEAKLGKLSYQESFDAADFEECEQAIFDARKALGLKPGATVARSAKGGASREVHVGVIHAGDNPHQAFAAPTREALERRIAEWCLARWDGAADKALTLEQAKSKPHGDVISSYFDGHDTDDVIMSVDEDGGIATPAGTAPTTGAKPTRRNQGAWIAMISFDGGSTGFAAATEADVKARAADWCLTNWNSAGDKAMTLEEAMEADVDTVIDAYFSEHDCDTMEIEHDEDADLKLGRVPRLLVAIRNGVAQVEAADGKVDVAIVDFDIDEPLSQEEVEAKTSFTRHSGDGATMDGLVDGHAEFLATHFGDGNGDGDGEE